MAQTGTTNKQSELVGTTLAERYEIIKQIGSGSMGAVFEARHAVLGRRLSVKVLKQDCSSDRLKERFFNEARAAGAITHQHIVQVYDFGLVPSGEPYIVMEYVDGEDLQVYMDRKGALKPDDAVEIISQVLSTLDVIHNAGLVHRDIKPSNIMLVKARRPRLFTKLLDFGIAKAVNEEWDWPTLTRVDEVLGTPVYLSPEQAMGGKADRRWDLWAVGIMMYELLTGKLPFPTKSLVQISEDIVNHNLTPIAQACPELPRWLLSVQSKALHPRLKTRFLTAVDFLHALEDKQIDEQVLADFMPRDTPPPPPPASTAPPPPAPGEARRKGRVNTAELVASMALPEDDGETIPLSLHEAELLVESAPSSAAEPAPPAPAPAPAPLAQLSTDLVLAPPPAAAQHQPAEGSGRGRWILMGVLLAVIAGSIAAVLLWLLQRSQ